MQNNSQSDVVADTRETPEIVAEKLEVKQVGAEFELLKDSHSDVVADTKENSETLAEEPVVKQIGVEGLVTRALTIYLSSVILAQFTYSKYNSQCAYK